MKLLLSIGMMLMTINLFATTDSVHQYQLPDSVTAVSIIADANVQSSGIKESFTGIQVKGLKLYLEAEKKEREVKFQFPNSATIVATGINVEKEDGELEWEYDWKLNTTYKLLIASAADSAENFILYSAYIFLPEESKWKLIGTCRINGERPNIKDPAAFFSNGKKNRINASITNVWVQRSSGSWKQLSEETQPVRPSINPLTNIDSVQQYQADKTKIEKAISEGKADAMEMIEGVYYKIINPGSGKSFTVADSITARYQLRIFGTTEVISGSETESYTFALKSLIKAWQLAVPLIKTGGKIRLVIPSGLAYSIRTRAPKIPPNSILEFDVEVLDAKPASK
jgi:FKBP-type peptidyl-prolyl cis-trans isomerase FkpA